jgi:hypothetical protein
MKASPFRRALAATVAVAVVTAVHAPAAWGAGAASLSGLVFDSDGRTPRTGVTVSLVDAQGGEHARSLPTRTSGAFAVEAPAGSYGVLVETPDGAFVTPTPVDLSPGANPPLSLSLQGRAIHAERDEGFGSAEGGLPGWAKWLIIGAISATALFVLIEASEDEDDPASPF